MGSYDPDVLVKRVRSVCEDSMVREIWLSSEDTGAYGRDLGIDITLLLQRIASVLPQDHRVMLRIGVIKDFIKILSFS